MESNSGAAGGAGSECEGEDQEDSSSSHSGEVDVLEVFDALNIDDNSEESQKRDHEEELAAFRQQWHQELETTPSPNKEVPKPEEAEPQTEEEKAKQLFLRGVEMERGGKLYEAIQHYKRAMQILPDVETRLYESSDLKSETPEEESETEETVRDHTSLSDDEEYVEGEELVTRLQRIFARKYTICEPEVPTREGHISWLPAEVVLTVVRWVVGVEHDVRALARLSGASRGLYLLCSDARLWRELCVRTWGIECGSPRAFGFPSWRQMYIERPRLQLNGCYISKTTYLRHGENSFQDQFYRPWYLIDYFRYLRFFSDGLVLMWCTPDEPSLCIGQLKYRTPKPGLGIMTGHYRLMGDKVVIVIKKNNSSEKKPAQPTNTRFRSRRKDSFEQHEQTFQMEMEICTVRGRRNHLLAWRRYLVSTRSSTSQMDTSGGKFPPLAFSGVRSYCLEARAPLEDCN